VWLLTFARNSAPPQDLRIIVALVRLAQPPKSRTYDNLQSWRNSVQQNKHWLQWVQLLEHFDELPFAVSGSCAKTLAEDSKS